MVTGPAPYISAAVHYVALTEDGTAACRAAVITEIIGDPRQSAGLCVLHPAGITFEAASACSQGFPLRQGETRKYLCGDRDYPAGTWHWLTIPHT